MTSAEKANQILEALRSQGARITTVRKLTIQKLIQAKKPISVSDILTMFAKSKRDVNKTTIYREMDYLLKAGVVREVNILDGQTRYEIAIDPHNHSHLVCTQCNQIECLPTSNILSKIEKSIKKESGFSVTHHVLEFFGLCKTCKKT